MQCFLETEIGTYYLNKSSKSLSVTAWNAFTAESYHVVFLEMPFLVVVSARDLEILLPSGKMFVL